MTDKHTSEPPELKETGRGMRILIDTDRGEVRSHEEMNERARRYGQEKKDGQEDKPAK